jgi:hypothetical protein
MGSQLNSPNKFNTQQESFKISNPPNRGPGADKIPAVVCSSPKSTDKVKPMTINEGFDQLRFVENYHS